MELAGEAGLFGKVEGYKDLTAPGLEAGLNRTLTATRLDSRSYPVSETEYCSTQDNLTFKCRIPMEQSPFLVHGFDVTYKYTADGAFISASVNRLTWRRP